MKQLLEFSGIDPERLVLKWGSSAEGPRFAKVVTEFVDKIKALGPSPLRKSRTHEVTSNETSTESASQM